MLGVLLNYLALLPTGRIHILYKSSLRVMCFFFFFIIILQPYEETDILAYFSEMKFKQLAQCSNNLHTTHPRKYFLSSATLIIISVMFKVHETMCSWRI